MSSSSFTDEIFTFGHTAVITGSSSGIGRAAAVMCAEKGMNVYMADIDRVDLEEAVEHVKAVTMSVWPAEQGGKIHIEGIVTDVADLASVEQLRDEVVANHVTCHFLMNNAGTGLGGGAMTDMATVHKVMEVNTYGPMHGCLAFVPIMKQGGQIGLIVNTGSKQGITMPPGNLTYNISKAALKAYTEGLEHELRNERFDSGGKLYAALLVPGWVNTSLHLKTVREKCSAEGKEFTKNSVFFHEDKPAAGAWMSEQVIEFMLEELNRGRFYIICPDNDVDRETDNLRMTWTMGDIVENRPPLSRWHRHWTAKFEEFFAQNKKG